MWQQLPDIEELIYMSKISEVFKNKKLFVGFLTAGDPSLEKTEEFIIEMAEAGAGLIEIGIPFSDPIAESTIIQEANVRALSAPNGCTTDMVFDMVARVSKKIDVPLVFVTYLNPVFKYGYDNFCRRCQETGVSGIVIPDMPYEESKEITSVAENYDVDIISTVASTSMDRVRMIAKEAKGYVMILSSAKAFREDELPEDILDVLDNIKAVTDTPIVMGSGVKNPEQVLKYGPLADGIIVKSAIVKIIAKYGEEAGPYIREYIKSMAIL